MFLLTVSGILVVTGVFLMKFCAKLFHPTKKLAPESGTNNTQHTHAHMKEGNLHPKTIKNIPKIKNNDF